jgi:hypothetical protein
MIDTEIHFAPPAFAGAGGQHAASSRPRYTPICPAIGSARDAQIWLRLASPSSRDPVKYPGWRRAAQRLGFRARSRCAFDRGRAPESWWWVAQRRGKGAQAAA